MQMAGVREGAPQESERARLELEEQCGANKLVTTCLNSMNELKSCVSSDRRPAPAAVLFFLCQQKKLTHKLLSLRRSITQDLRIIIQSIKIRIFYVESMSRFIDSTF